MKAKIEQIISKLPGKIGVYYKDLDSNASFGINDQEKFLAASVIKVPIMAVMYNEIYHGRLRRDDMLTVHSKDMVAGCGALYNMHSGLQVSMQDLCNLMITISDNTATNLLIETLGMDKLNDQFAKFGLTNTQVHRKLFDREEQMKGKENYFTPADIGMLLEQIYQRTLISKSISQEMEGILRRQQINAKIPHLLPNNVKMAHKTGESSGITHDVGIIFSDSPFILCFASNETDVVQTEAAMREAALACYQQTEVK